MDRIKDEWQARNTLLQEAYKSSLLATKQIDKEEANLKIQKALEWPPFEELCFKLSASTYGISKYGLDSATEKCIGLIDKIAKGEIDYNY